MKRPNPGIKSELDRFHVFLSDNGIHLPRFSTDTMVDACMPKLKALQDEIEACDDQGCKEMLPQLKIIIRRSSANRITNDKQASEVKTVEQVQGLQELEDFLK